MTHAIEVKNLSKLFTVKERLGIFKSRTIKIYALKNVSLAIKNGEFFGLLGPNGAGKTTLIKCLTTLLIPSNGDAWVNGFHIIKDEYRVRASLGCMLMGERGLYWKLTGRENLHYFGALYHIPKDVREKRIEYITNLLTISSIIDRQVENYSSGQKMLMAFAKSLINDAPILLLDEPTITMDVHTARMLRTIIKNLHKEGKTILYTTHLMHEADELCERVAIIDNGKIIAVDTPSNLKSSLKRENVLVIEGFIPPYIKTKIGKIETILRTSITTSESGLNILTLISKNKDNILPTIIKLLAEENAKITNIHFEEPTLEDVFVSLTGRHLR